MNADACNESGHGTRSTYIGGIAFVPRVQKARESTYVSNRELAFTE